jgi:hypothetical protein
MSPGTSVIPPIKELPVPVDTVIVVAVDEIPPAASVVSILIDE